MNKIFRIKNDIKSIMTRQYEKMKTCKLYDHNLDLGHIVLFDDCEQECIDLLDNIIEKYRDDVTKKEIVKDLKQVKSKIKGLL